MAESTMLPSLAQMQLEAQNSNLVEEVDGQDHSTCHGLIPTWIDILIASAPSDLDEPSVHNISDMPDPDSIYSSTLGDTNISKSFINMPNICDGNGALIRPDKYAQKMQMGDIVINSYLKL